jgi:hypothetical protein
VKILIPEKDILPSPSQYVTDFGLHSVDDDIMYPSFVKRKYTSYEQLFGSKICIGGKN